MISIHSNRHPFSRIRLHPVGPIALSLLFLAACNYPYRAREGTSGPIPAGELSATAPETETAGSSAPSRTLTGAGAPAAKTEPVGDTPTYPPTLTATVAHLTSPGNPGTILYYLGDYSSKNSSAYKSATGGDNFAANLYERPFLADGMKYLPEIDILRADIAKDAAWFYITIRLEEAPGVDEPSARYGVEIDTELDGRGNYLIWTSPPNGTAWSTDGVQILQDENLDVGGMRPLVSETSWKGDGYERMVFDQGQGADPDSAWARMAPDNPTYVQIAFKQSAIGNDLNFLWSVWADAGVRQPGWFDYNDHFVAAEVGSPIASAANYPLKALAAVDNTCRMSLGFTLIGDEPGACPVFAPTATLTPTQTPTPVVFLASAVGISFPSSSVTTTCPFVTVLQVTITATAPGYVYFDVYSSKDGAPYAFWVNHSSLFHAAGTQTTNLGVNITSSQALRMRVHVTSPNSLWSNEASITVSCS